MLSTILSSLALVCALVAVLLGLVAVDITKKKSARSISLRRMTRLEAEMTETTDALHSVREAMHKMRSRQNMKALRDERANGKLPYDNGEPTDPDEWYRWARKKYMNPTKEK